MTFAQQSKFHLMVQQSICGIAVLVCGMLFLRVEAAGALAMGAVIIYLSRINREIKKRREPLTSTQKRIIFGLLAAPLGLIVAVLLVLALRYERPIWWIAFSLAFVYVGASLFFVYGELQKDDVVA